MRYLVWVSLFEEVVAMRTFVLWQFSNVSICVSATFSSGTAEIRALDLKNLIRVEWSSENSYVLLILRCIYVRVQLSPQKQQKYKLSSEKTLSERDGPMRTAIFCRLWGVSTWVCNFLLGNSEKYECSTEKPYPREMIQWEQLCSVDFVVYLRACAIFSSETAEIRVLEWKNPIRERWSNEKSYVLSIWTCFYVRAQLSP